MIPDLRRDDLLLEAGQQPLRLGQVQTQVGDIGEITEGSGKTWADVSRRINTPDVRMFKLQAWKFLACFAHSSE
jgi:hypothetical protein